MYANGYEPSNFVIELYYLVHRTHQVLIVLKIIVGMVFYFSK